MSVFLCLKSTWHCFSTCHFQIQHMFLEEGKGATSKAFIAGKILNWAFGCMLNYRVSLSVLFKCLQSSFVGQVNLQISYKALNLQILNGVWCSGCLDSNWLFSGVTTVPPFLLQCTHAHTTPHRCLSWPPTVVLHSVAFSLCNPTPTHYPASKCQHHAHRQAHAHTQTLFLTQSERL